MIQKKIIFLHGFFASGQCIPALTLKEEMKERAIVLTPDLPLHPKEALRFVLDLCKEEQPDLLVGNSCGSFLAQMAATKLGLPALLGNPYFEMTKFLKERVGEHQYKSPRKNGNQLLIIDEGLIDEFAELENIQWDECRASHKNRIWGLFGDNDTLAHYEPMFLEHYTHSFHFPGGHTPTADEVKQYYVPLIEELLESANG